MCTRTKKGYVEWILLNKIEHNVGSHLLHLLESDKSYIMVQKLSSVIVLYPLPSRLKLSDSVANEERTVPF